MATVLSSVPHQVSLSHMGVGRMMVRVFLPVVEIIEIRHPQYHTDSERVNCPLCQGLHAIHLHLPNHSAPRRWVHYSYLQTRTLRLRGLRRLAKGHTASTWFKPRQYDSEVHILYYSILFSLQKVTLGNSPGQTTRYSVSSSREGLGEEEWSGADLKGVRLVLGS